MIGARERGRHRWLLGNAIGRASPPAGGGGACDGGPRVSAHPSAPTQRTKSERDPASARVAVGIEDRVAERTRKRRSQGDRWPKTPEIAVVAGAASQEARCVAADALTGTGGLDPAASRAAARTSSHRCRPASCSEGLPGAPRRQETARMVATSSSQRTASPAAPGGSHEGEASCSRWSPAVERQAASRHRGRCTARHGPENPSSGPVPARSRPGHGGANPSRGPAAHAAG